MEKLREVTKLAIGESPLSERGIHLTTYVDLATVDGDTSFSLSIFHSRSPGSPVLLTINLSDMLYRVFDVISA